MRQVTSSSGWCCILSSVIGIRGVFRAGFLFGVRMARGRHWALRWFLGHTLGFAWLRASRQPLAARPTSADRRSWRGWCVLVAGGTAVAGGPLFRRRPAMETGRRTARMDWTRGLAAMGVMVVAAQGVGQCVQRFLGAFALLPGAGASHCPRPSRRSAKTDGASQQRGLQRLHR